MTGRQPKMKPMPQAAPGPAPRNTALDGLNRSIEFRAVDRLKRYERNARTHKPHQVAEIADSLLEWGWTMPILIDERDGIIAGEGRSLAAKKLYAAGKTFRLATGGAVPKGMVPVIIARGWTEKQRRAYVLADNKIGLNSGWDETLLNFELSALNEIDFDLDLTGFHDLADNTSTTKEGAIIEDTAEMMSSDEGKFWITLRGPLEDQARVLDAIKQALGEPGKVSIDIGSAAGSPEGMLDS